MDHLWTPWRYRYLQHAPEPDLGCIFCVKAAERRDDENFIVHRARHNFIILNLYPYTTGHMMVVPYEHVASLADAHAETLEEMMDIARKAETALTKLYKPHGLNVGMNIGEAAGAGIASHIHMHVLPRWRGDANFVSTVGETRIMPEELPCTYEKLRREFSL